MICERCKIREANIQYTEVINGIKTEHNFCAQCAKEMDFGPYSAIFDGEFPLAKLLSGLLGEEETTRKQDKLEQIFCPSCKTSYTEFIKNSRFGCADCYSIFGPLINDSIKQLQGSDAHIGKKPKYQSKDKLKELSDVPDQDHTMTKEEAKEQIGAWNARLQEALKREEYEMAAQCRDRIKALKERSETDA